MAKVFRRKMNSTSNILNSGLYGLFSKNDKVLYNSAKILTFLLSITIAIKYNNSFFDELEIKFLKAMCVIRKQTFQIF